MALGAAPKTILSLMLCDSARWWRTGRRKPTRWALCATSNVSMRSANALRLTPKAMLMTLAPSPEYFDWLDWLVPWTDVSLF